MTILVLLQFFSTTKMVLLVFDIFLQIQLFSVMVTDSSLVCQRNWEKSDKGVHILLK